MSVARNELEPKTGFDELAEQVVDGYLERIEKQTETKPQSQPSPSPVATTGTSLVSIADDASNKALSLAPKMIKQQIILPLDEEGVRLGLHHKIMDAVRWLAVWSVYMIKKYPGRVFYPPRGGME